MNRLRWISLFLIAALPLAAQESEPTRYAILVTGNELLKGIYQDGHTVFITSKLEPLGCKCVTSMSIGDDRDDLMNALEYASQRADLIILTGGLGPTDADITRQTLSEFSGIPIEEHPDVMQHMMQRFRVSADDMRENLRRQAKVPVQGGYMVNRVGTSYGLIFDDGKKVIAAFPGPPRELQPMLVDEFIPFLAKRFGTHTIGSKVKMRFVGVGESTIDHTLHQQLKLPSDLMLEFQFELGRVDLTFILPNDSEDDRKRLKTLEADLLSNLGEFFYTDEDKTLEGHVLDLLKKNGATLSVAEVGSGGAVSAALAEEDDADDIYLGGFVAHTQKGISQILNVPGADQLSGGVSQENTEQLARLICQKTGSSWAIAVSEAESIDNNRNIWVSIGSIEAGFKNQRLSLRGRGREAQDRLVTEIMDLLRRRLNSIHEE